MSTRLTLLVVLALFSNRVAAQVAKPTNSSSDCNYVVGQVSFENPTGLTDPQIAALRRLVLGRCYEPERQTYISGYVYQQLRAWGYKRSTVYDPKEIRVLDSSVHPSPIAVTIDFCLSGLDDFGK
jgi:hypothetical protein